MIFGFIVFVIELDGFEKLLRVELGKVNIDFRRIICDVGIFRMLRFYFMGLYEYVVDFFSLEFVMELMFVLGYV